MKGIAMDATVKIVIVDDHKLFTAGLSSILQLLGKNVEVEGYSCGRLALSRLEKGGLVDLVFVDLDMPTISGQDFLHAIKSRNLNFKVVVISASTDMRVIQKAMDSGASGYIPKSLSPDMMLLGVGAVLQGKIFIPEHLQSKIKYSTAQSSREEKLTNVGSGDTGQLSARHLEILNFMEKGLTNKEIANLLGLSVSTVKFHISALFKILNVKNRTQCIHVATERCLICDVQE